jgi:hypothetical protein
LLSFFLLRLSLLVINIDHCLTGHASRLSIWASAEFWLVSRLFGSNDDFGFSLDFGVLEATADLSTSLRFAQDDSWFEGGEVGEGASSERSGVRGLRGAVMKAK